MKLANGKQVAISAASYYKADGRLNIIAAFSLAILRQRDKVALAFLTVAS